jgi:hypothetical protein
MGRRKTAVAEANGEHTETIVTTEVLTETPPLALPVVTETVPEPVNTAPPEPPHTNGNGRKPVVSWRVQSDRTTSVELACWVNTYRTQAGEEYEQLSFTVTRSYKNSEEQWVKGGSWRTHDIPVLMFLLSKAHAYALDNRTTVSGETPF